MLRRADRKHSIIIFDYFPDDGGCKRPRNNIQSTQRNTTSCLKNHLLIHVGEGQSSAPDKIK